jgi:membrane protease YdiL (CAAX protease family)
MTADATGAPGTPATPEAPPFGARRAVWIVLAFLGVQLAVALVVGVVAGVHNLKKPGPASPGGVQIDLGVTLGAAFVGAVLGGLVAMRMVRRSFAGPGGNAVRAAVGWMPASGRACARAALGGLALVAAFVVVGVALPVRPHELGALARAANTGGWPRLLWATLAIAVAPPTEELVFRGALYAGLARSWNATGASVVTTAVFLALHGTELGAYWPAWIAIATLALVALRLRLATGSLLPAIALHASYNLGLVLMAYAAGPRA